VLGALDLQRGDLYRPAVVDAELSRYRGQLQARGYYEARVNDLPRLSDDGQLVDLTILVETGPTVLIRFEGDALPEREREALVPVARERSVDEDLLEDSKRRIESRLREQGYRDARVDYRRDDADETLTVAFTVTRGPLHRLAGIEIEGSAIEPDLRALLRLRAGEPFVDAILSADVAGMAELYRRQGFTGVAIDTTVTSTAGLDEGTRLVTARLTVGEGPRAVIGAVTFEGNRALDAETLHAIAGLTPDQPYYDPQTTTAADAIAIEYANRGYQSVLVLRALTFSDDRQTVDVAFQIMEGTQILIDQVLISGNLRTSAALIERELVVESGEPLGQSALIESQRRLNALGLFRRIQITQVRHPGDEGRQDVLVMVEEAPATTLGWGGGPEGGKRLRRSADGVAEERIEFGARGFFEVGRRNLWGKNRSVNLFARLGFRPRGESVVTPAGPAEGPTTSYGLNEYRVLLTYREPRILGTAADGQLTGVLEQGIRSSFNFSRRVTSFEVVRRLTSGTSVSSRYSLEQTRLFDEQPNPEEQPIIDRLFPQVRLSSFSSTLIRDTRGDPIEPIGGTLTTIDGVLAARAIGSEVGFARTLLKGFFYRQLPRAPRLVLAGGGTLGLAHGFARDVETDAGLERVQDLPASERFFAGGDTTVRGFALDRLGAAETIDENGFPTGGHALVVFNTELRARVWRDLGAVGFLDVGNVFARVSGMDLGALRGSVGLGLRYSSPIGPIRVDLGFKLSRFEYRTGRLLDDGRPETRLEPRTALHISLGQAF
jgi:outer membrane protein insertion porin family